MFLTVLIKGSGFPRLRSSVTLLQSMGRTILVDSGLCDDGPRLVRLLGDRGLSVDQIDTVVASHLHYDHCGNHLLFRKAEYLVGAKDFEDTALFVERYHRDETEGKKATAELLRSSYQSVKEFYVRSIVREMTRNIAFYDAVLERGPRFLPIKGSHWLTKEVELLPTPGHTRGHLSVIAHRAQVDGEGPPLTVLVAGDAIFTNKSLNEQPGQELHLAADTQLYCETRRKLLVEYSYIIPGHDGLVATPRASLLATASI